MSLVRNLPLFFFSADASRSVAATLMAQTARALMTVKGELVLVLLATCDRLQATKAT